MDIRPAVDGDRVHLVHLELERTDLPRPAVVVAGRQEEALRRADHREHRHRCTSIHRRHLSPPSVAADIVSPRQFRRFSHSGH